MSAAAERVLLAETARDLLTVLGTAGERRGSALIDDGASPAPAVAFATLAAAPAWLRWSRQRQHRLAELVALRAMAAVVAASIDGAWLGALARQVGDHALDWAIGAAVNGPAATGEAVAPERLAARGFAMLRAMLSPSLRGYLWWAPAGVAAPDPQALAEALGYLAEKGE